MNYCIIMKYSAKENCYIVTVPDLPGCMADGESPNEAYENAKIVIREWIETAQADRFWNQYLGGTNFKGQLLPPLCLILFCFFYNLPV